MSQVEKVPQQTPKAALSSQSEHEISKDWRGVYLAVIWEDSSFLLQLQTQLGLRTSWGGNKQSVNTAVISPHNKLPVLSEQRENRPKEMLKKKMRLKTKR